MISTETSRHSYAGDGSTTAFIVSFDFFDQTELDVWLRDSAGVQTLQTLTTDYTVSGGSGGGTVTMVTAPAIGETLVILRNVPKTQLTDLVSNDILPAQSLEDSLDRLIMIVQELSERLDRAQVVEETSPNTPLAPTLNEKVVDIGAWDMNGTASVSIAHGLTFATIRSVRVVIFNDAGSNYYPLEYDNAGTGASGYLTYNGANVVLSRQSGRFFDGSGFNDSTINRGYIVIQYT